MNRPVKESCLVSGTSREVVFDALLEVERFPEWAYGLLRARAVDSSGQEDVEVRPGTTFEFTLSALGLTHEVTSVVTEVEAPRRLRWRYERGAVGGGGWHIEEEGPQTVRMTLETDYEVEPAWLDRLANRPFFRGVTENLLRRSIRCFAGRMSGVRERRGESG